MADLNGDGVVEFQEFLPAMLNAFDAALHAPGWTPETTAAPQNSASPLEIPLGPPPQPAGEDSKPSFRDLLVAATGDSDSDEPPPGGTQQSGNNTAFNGNNTVFRDMLVAATDHAATDTQHSSTPGPGGVLKDMLVVVTDEAASEGGIGDDRVLEAKLEAIFNKQ
eukprot:TRINITY_DN6606_c0_g1_i5.p1 TRINITY_DN6606_c0_g1~~TRINITY_DN6606_c0_g1_i5.p1  ORF type:complete len:165 (+),score=37.94 TRINITY_DN6606_c0_g1_i5:521-1015(+)